MESPLRCALPLSDDFRLIETLRGEAGGFVRLPAHLARLARGAARLGIPLDHARVMAALAPHAGPGPLRIRLTLAPDGAVEATAAPLVPDRAPWVLAIAAPRLRSDDPWLGLKSSRRPIHDAVRAALGPGIDEAILLNERDEVCEGTITTVFADLGDGLVTPPLAAGCLPGVLRAELLARGQAREAPLRPADLGAARLWVGNALRGLIPARLV